MKKTRRILAIALAAMIALTLLVSCTTAAPSNSSNDSAGSAAPAAKPGKNMMKDEIKIAFVPLSFLGSLNIPIMKAVAETLAQYPNVKIVEFEAMYDANNQISLMEDAIAQKCDAIILETADPAGLANVVKKAEDAGIPVITQNLICEAVHTAHIQMSDYEAGQSAGENIKRLCGDKGNVIVLDGPVEQANVRVMGKGCIDYIKNNSNMEIIDTQYIEAWNQENAATAMRNLLTKYDDIAAVYACNDDMANGAIQAIKAAGREGIVVWGYVGMESGLMAIKDGSLAGTNYQDTYALMVAMLNCALFNISTGHSAKTLGLTATPFISMSCPAITKDNVDVYLTINRYAK
jgi:ABC-type sugar transport system substrate-binding protein